MAYDNALTALLTRNANLFEGKRVLMAGDISDENLLKLVKPSLKASIVADHFVAASKMAGLFLKTLEHGCPQTISCKHLSVYFAASSDALELIKQDPDDEPYDILCLLLTKTKAVSLDLLHKFQDKLKDGALILVAGANDAGGRSGGKLINNTLNLHKLDTARKCTLFAGTYDRQKPFAAPAATKDLVLYVKNEQGLLSFKEQRQSDAVKLTLKQHPAVFSPGVIDEGTRLLLSSIPLGELEGRSILDLCCGCGVIGLCLHPYAGLLTLADAGAQAVALTRQNLKLNEASGQVYAADFADGLGKFDAIVLNPPFHQGIKADVQTTLQGLKSLKEHLNKAGCIYMVSNCHLNYEAALQQDFLITVLAKTNRFAVHKLQP